MQYYIDRIADGNAVLEDESGNSIVINSSFLPEGAREGSVLKENDGEFFLCEDEEQARRRKLFELQNKIKAKKRSGS
ncbi:MAG: DUF3006 domain-containing protein [Oscillospiraceae bacterium]|nr:DUF3006 domain-containing protein [Oscillospiraceae bacterium]